MSILFADKKGNPSHYEKDEQDRSISNTRF